MDLDAFKHRECLKIELPHVHQCFKTNFEDRMNKTKRDVLDPNVRKVSFLKKCPVVNNLCIGDSGFVYFFLLETRKLMYYIFVF